MWEQGGFKAGEMAIITAGDGTGKSVFGKYWTIVFPGEFGQHVQETWSEEQILNSYWDYWCKRMTEAGKDPEVHTFQDCIDDWCTLHWAEQTDQWGRREENHKYNSTQGEPNEIPTSNTNPSV